VLRAQPCTLRVVFVVPTPKDRAERRERHSHEVEASQAALRSSIKDTERLVDQSDEMLRRHRDEHEAGDVKRAQRQDPGEVQRLRELAEGCRREAANSTTEEARIGLTELADNFERLAA
jgi:hypothetical protein